MYAKLNNRPKKVIEYYKDYRLMNETRLAKAVLLRDELNEKLIEYRKEVYKYKDNYKTRFNINLDSYEEWNKNTRIDGSLLKTAKGAFINRGEELDKATEAFRLLQYAKCLEDIYETQNVINLSKKVAMLKTWSYADLISLYTKKIHEKLILEGAGYSFGYGIGALAINRVHINKKKNEQQVDFNKTNKLRRQLKAEGKAVYDKATAEWCAVNNIPYNVKPVFVYSVHPEYYYEYDVINSVIKNYNDWTFEPNEYRQQKSLKGLSNDDIQELCKNDLLKVCNTDINCKTKLSICLNIKPELFNNFIRYENQESITTRKINWKDRQRLQPSGERLDTKSGSVDD